LVYFPSPIIFDNNQRVLVDRVPANCVFEVDDITKPWTHQNNSFDFIHCRGLYGSIGSWSILLREIYQRVKPGGWFESVETTVQFCYDDGPRGEGQPIPESNPMSEWCKLALEAAERLGRPFDVAGRVGPWMEDAGFVNVVTKEYKIPLGPWPKDPHMKEIGRYNLLNMLEAVGEYSGVSP
jgi:SAM-dependent methyltransferase